MLFNSFPFILVFVPVVLAGFFGFERAGRPALARGWLILCSTAFYAYWRPPYLLLLVASILFNYWTAQALYRVRLAGDLRRARTLLAVRVAVNLAILAYFKYVGFFASVVASVAGLHLTVPRMVLPLGISFYTFTEIAFLVDIYQLRAKPGRLSHYFLFVTFFPHLIAGPIVHYRNLMPQFERRVTRSLLSVNAVTGLTLFVLGLFKKVVVADGVSVFASPMFDVFLPGSGVPSLVPAWGAALAYTFQLYFDFSGYSDMAIGLALLFGIRFPLNFNSPYKATSIIDFWRRWHMTLSAFLRDYLYVPLGGNRKGPARRYVNLLVTMALGGLWHGAGWTFVLWGILHGLYLMCNHAWRTVVDAFGARSRGAIAAAAAEWSSRLLTFGCVVVGWAIFRSHSLLDAIVLLKGMSGRGGVVLPIVIRGAIGGSAPLLERLGVRFESLDVRFFGGAVEIEWIAVLLAGAMMLPNTQELLGIEPGREWAPSRRWALACAGAFTVALATLAARSASEFLYFNF